MASNIPKHIIKNCTVFIDKDNRIGQVEEVTTPEIELKTETFLNGGMIKEREVPMGVVSALTLALKETAFDGDVMDKLGQTDKEYMVVGAMSDADGSNEQDAVIYCRGVMKKFDAGSLKPGDKASSDYEIAADYIKLQIGDRQIFEITDYWLKVAGEIVYGYKDSMING